MNDRVKVMEKVVSKEEFLEIKKTLRGEGKKIVLCHGVFDLIHPGHIAYFEEARRLGDILVVSITAAKYVRKGPGRPYFDDGQRMKVLSAIEYIDYVLLSEGYTADDMIICVEPDFYVKGNEYSDSSNDITGKIVEETELVEMHGGKVCFTNGQVFSSTKLINKFMPALTDEVKSYIENLSKRFCLNDFKGYFKEMEELKILVLGDVIIDNYTFCDVQGLMSKDRGYSVRYRNEEKFLGGAIAIARHLAQFCNNVTIASIIGNEREVHSRILNDLGKDMRIYLEYSKDYPTITKKRFIAVNPKREEFDKLFSVNELPNVQTCYPTEKESFYHKIEGMIKEFDMVVVCDFGHGLVDDRVMEIVQENAKYLAVNCQTNSANYGMNLITKYRKADTFSLDQKELRLAFHDRQMDEGELLGRLKDALGAKDGWLTQASHGATGVSVEGMVSCPALTLDVKDTVGAGDAFFSVVSLCSILSTPLEVSTFLGNVAGALAANILGNEKPIDKVDVLKYIATLLNV